MYHAAKISFFPDQISHNRYLLHNNKTSMTGLHNPSNYANASKPTWCIIRDPIDRAVSSYNMRNRPRTCNASHIDDWIEHNFIRENEKDGHFFASVAYLQYCTLPVLYEKSHEMVATRLNVTMRHVTWGSTHTCTRNHLSNRVTYALMEKYKEDIRLRQAIAILNGPDHCT